ncbi:HAD hydrolase family protein, partial [Microbacterium sp. AGC62]
DGAVKATSLQEWAAELGVPSHATIAIGDGANDLQMMAVAGLGLAFNAKPAVREAASLVIGPPDLSEVIALLP